MIIDRYPKEEIWKEILQRPALNVSGLYDNVQAILDRVREEGDKALFEYEKMFDKIELQTLAVSEKELAEAAQSVSEELKTAIQTAAKNIEKFHSAQKQEFKKISWTDRKSVVKQTIAVVSVSVVVGLIIAVLDWMIQYGVDFLLGLKF